MKPFPLIAFLLLSIITVPCFAQKEDLQYVKKEFLIVRSTPDYETALKTAQDAGNKLKLKTRLRNLKPNKEIGLTDSRVNCESDFGFFPCYVPRGRSDDGSYISIEYSDAYIEFQKGYYIVVAASYETGNPKSKELLLKTKKIYKDAYLKTSKVYVGCIH